MQKNIIWAENQVSIFDNVKNGNGHMIVAAVPGSGKTTTLCESLNYIDIKDRKKIFFTSFNRKIIDDIRNKIPSEIDYGTNHKLGYQAVLKKWQYRYKKIKVDSKNDVGYMLATREVGSDISNEVLKMNLIKAMDFAKITLAKSSGDILNVINKYNIDTTGKPEEEFVSSVENMLEATRNRPQKCKGQYMVSFADMIWLPCINNWETNKYDRIFIDEAQDLSPVRTKLLLSALNPGGRLLAVGDRFQSIFSFAGSDIESIDKLKAVLTALEMPLSVSYRCPTSVVELARLINPSIAPAANAKEGLVETVDGSELYKRVGIGDVIISRTNYPLIKAWFAYIKKGIRANMPAKDIGDKFIWKINSWQPTSVTDLVQKIETWRDYSITRLRARNKSVRYVNDEADSLLKFCDKAESLRDVLSRIIDFFDYNENTQITLLTAHKSKGLEYDKVFVLKDTFNLDSVEEKNIWYVAITRTKDYLGLVEGKIPKE
jgi:superfamily I DNA/RNA helicase